MTVELEAEMVKNHVKIMTVHEPFQARKMYGKLIQSLSDEKFVGIDCEGITGNKLALMIQVRQ